MTKKIKMGRPKKSASELRGTNLQIRLTRDEAKAIRAAAGGNMSEWARVVLLRAAGK